MGDDNLLEYIYAFTKLIMHYTKLIMKQCVLSMDSNKEIDTKNILKNTSTISLKLVMVIVFIEYLKLDAFMRDNNEFNEFK